MIKSSQNSVHAYSSCALQQLITVDHLVLLAISQPSNVSYVISPALGVNDAGSFTLEYWPQVDIGMIGVDRFVPVRLRSRYVLPATQIRLVPITLYIQLLDEFSDSDTIQLSPSNCLLGAYLDAHSNPISMITSSILSSTTIFAQNIQTVARLHKLLLLANNVQALRQSISKAVAERDIATKSLREQW